jgi:hypothetical protein
MNADHGGTTLCAWLDGELPEAEASAFALKLDEDAGLRDEVERFRRSDALVRAWYGSLTQWTAPGRLPLPGRRTSRPFLRLGGMAAAVFLIIVSLFALWPGGSTESRAQEVVERTGQSAVDAPGILVTFKAVVITQRDEPDARGNREDKRTAKGEIRFSHLWSRPLLFRSQETWAAVDDEPELVRSWGQAVIPGDDRLLVSQWLTERQGRSFIAREITRGFDANLPPPGGPLSDDRADGSPVDLRTRQAVEGLASLIRSFHSDPFLKWMGYSWRQDGGKGTRAEPWRYRMQLGPPTTEKKGIHTAWTLRLSAPEKNGIIDRIDLEERVIDGQTGAQLSSFQTEYKIELRTEAWPAETFGSH